MENLIPSNFIEALGGLLIGLTVVLSFVSLWPPLRSHSIRLLALFIVSALSLFSNHWTTFFAGIFVVATAVTELEFLQNLAAIIRGNKDYFDYKKESLSIEQKKEIIKEDIEEQAQLNEQSIEKIDDEPPNITVKSYNPIITATPPNIERHMNVEEKALDKMEEYYGEKIERGVRLIGKERRIELDGLIPSVVDDMVSEKIIEVKYLRSPNYFRTIKNLLPKIEDLARTYCEITKKIAKLHIVLVIEGDKSLSEEQIAVLKKLIDSSNIAMGYSVFTTEQLGIQKVT